MQFTRENVLREEGKEGRLNNSEVEGRKCGVRNFRRKDFIVWGKQNLCVQEAAGSSASVCRKKKKKKNLRKNRGKTRRNAKGRVFDRKS